jgi:hypothetical protein
MLSTVRNVFGLRIAKRAKTKTSPMIGPSVERKADQSTFFDVAVASDTVVALMPPP